MRLRRRSRNMAFHSVSHFPSKLSVRIYFNIFLIIWASCYNTSVTGGEQESSQTVLAKVGDDVVLPCQVKSKNLQTVEWTRPDLKPPYVYVLQDGRVQFRYSNQLYKQRTVLSAEGLSHGNISLKLFRAELSDEGKFKCFVPNLENSSLIQLLVGSVSQPKISLIGIEGDDLSWTCDSGCWYPHPEVSWVDSEGNNITAKPPVTERHSQHCYVVQRNVTVMRGMNVTCRVHLSHINHTNAVKTPLEGEISASVAESGPNGGLIAGMIIFAAAVVMLLGYFYRKNKQTGKQEYNNAAARFVMQHRAELILNVSRVIEILHSLGPMVSFELDAEIKEEKTSMDQMMRLFREILEPGGVEVQAAFYDALKEHQSDLLNTLDNHVMTEHPAIPRPKDLWSRCNCPVLCGARDTQDTDGVVQVTEVDAVGRKAPFVMKNRAQLIQNVSRVMAIVDSLGSIVDPELRTKIEAKKTTLNQMRILYTVMTDDHKKAAFYNALEQHEPHLLKWLENPPTQDAVDLTPEQKAHFVEKNRVNLIKNVSRVMPILDTLGTRVHPELCAEIQEEETSLDQMWILDREILQPAGTKVRAAFYNALKKHQPHLLKILETAPLFNPSNQTAGPSVANDLHEAQDLETAPLLNPSNQTVGSSVAIDLHEAQDLETAPLLNPTKPTVGSSEPTHLVDQHWVERVVNSILELISHDVKSNPTIKEKMMEILHSGKATFLEEQCLPDNLKNPPCSTQQQECISETLEKLGDKEFQVFKLYLQQSDNLEGLQPLPTSLLEKTDRMDTANLILKTYTSNVDQIMKNVLEKIEQNADKATPEASACHFVDQHRDDLVKRVKMVAPILDLLLAEGVIKTEDYSNVMLKTTTQEKMGDLYELLPTRTDKDVFYRSLQEHEQFLLEDLKNPPCLTHIIDTLEELGQDEFKDFKSYLQQSDNLEGLQPLPKSLLENTDRMGTANLIVKTYYSNADQIVMNVLTKINKNDLVERFLPKGPEGENPLSGSDREKEKGPEVVNPPSVSGSEKGEQDDKTAGPEGENPPSGSDREKEKGPKKKLKVPNPISAKGKQEDKTAGPEDEPPTPTPTPTDDVEKEKGLKLKKLKGAMLTLNIRAGTFVVKERDSLIKRVTNVEPILAHLLSKEVITEAQKSDVMSEPKTVLQMKKLYEMLNNVDNVTKAKTTFYKGLQEYEKDLLEKLQA